MSTSTLTQDQSGPAVPSGGHRASADGAHHVTQGRVIIGEWVKFRSLRSSWITLLAAMIAMIGIGALITGLVDPGTATNRQGPGSGATAFDAFSTSIGGVVLAQLAIAVLAVLLITGEYSTGMIRASLTAVPKRLPVLWAKLTVFSVITFVTSLVGVLITFFLGQALLGKYGISIGDAHVVRALFGVALYLTLIGILSLAIGAMLRSTAGAIATVVGLLLIVPVIGNFLPSSYKDAIVPYLPGNAGGSMYALTTASGSLSAWEGLGVLCIWVVVAVTAAAVLLKRRDA